jgi:protein-tyrosine phosphatase
MPINILMVCLGNICRSPLAEGIMASKLPKDKQIQQELVHGTLVIHLTHALYFYRQKK